MNNTITEGYFGAEILPIEVLETNYGKIYVGEVVNRLGNSIVFYDENGCDPMELSSIDTDEFIRCLGVKQ